MKAIRALNQIFVLIVAVALFPMILCAEATNTAPTSQVASNATGPVLLEQLAGMEFDRAKDILDTLEPHQAVEWSLQLASSWYQRMAPDQMRSYIGYASSVAQKHNLQKEDAEIWFFRATVSRASYDLVGALSLVEEALKRASQSGHTNLLRQALGFKGNALEIQGRYGDAIEVYRELERTADKCGDGILKSDCIYSVALLQHRMGSKNLSEESLREAIRVYDKYQYPHGKANCLKMLGVYASDEKKNVEALGYYSEAAGIFKQTGDWVGYGNCYYNAGLLYRENNENEKAVSCFQEALAAFTSAAALSGVGIAHMELGRTYFVMNKYSDAEQSFSLAEGFLVRSQSQGNLAGLNSYMGDLKAAQGKKDEAAAHYTKAISIYEGLGRRDDAATQRMNLLKVRPIKSERKAR